MKRLLVCLVAIASTAAFAPLSAQNRADNGDWSVAIALFESGTGTVFSAGRMFSDRLHGAVEVTYRRADVSDDPEALSVGVKANALSGEWLIGPTVRFYGAQRGPVVPYLRAKVGFGNAVSDLTIGGSDLRDQDTFTIQGSVAIGAEWYPVKGIGISGHTGFQYSRETMERYNENDILLKRTTDNLGTFRSSLMLSFYFQ